MMGVGIWRRAQVLSYFRLSIIRFFCQTIFRLALTPETLAENNFESMVAAIETKMNEF
jgi:hypothetical protein